MLISTREKQMRSEELAFEAFEAYQGKIYMLSRPSTYDLASRGYFRKVLRHCGGKTRHVI